MTPKDICFVIDATGTPLAPTKVGKGWYLIRKKRAKLLEKSPMAIQLFKVVENPLCSITLGIDDGSKHVGVALVQETTSGSKCLFKGTIEQRQDVKKLMEQRASYRRNRRSEKRNRPARFDNRNTSRRKGRIPPTIKQKRQATLRFATKISNYVNINHITIEEAAFDIRSLTEGYTPFKWQYQRSNRLDESLRRATVLRDTKCQRCGASNCALHAHHIIPKRFGGTDSIYNLITLCSACHIAIGDNEMSYVKVFQSLIAGKNPNTKDAQHVMQGKHWLREQLSVIAPVSTTDGGTTANLRIDNDIPKSHANDAIVITGMIPKVIPLKDWQIKPKRKKRKMLNATPVCGLRHGDYVTYTDTKQTKWFGYVTAMYHDKQQVNVLCKTKHLKRANAKKCTLVYTCPRLSII